ncbi:membrane integrity-associated transporter subunit PqiC [Bordetella sp. BOR01]|uniref:PqiC family protein n=1 Tax=Bordetella sp. BOR01 TaxID=2854779 RepID=UPI001C47E472|nr:PqiC family protein [Bordetella sp. BOR01]MBV7485784.1 PqiC family protein [Bordetella sp. BOR01]
MRTIRYVPLSLSILALSALLSGCAGSPPAHFYTLQTAPQAVSPEASRAGFQIEVVPVSVPMQADQPQIMLREHEGDGALAPLYSHRWSAPLSDEIGAAMSDVLTRTLGALDVQTLRPADSTPVWRVQVDVQRFDMVAGGPARLDATWRVRPINLKGARTLICRAAVQMPADGQDIPALVQAQQRAVALMAQTIASAIQSGGTRAIPAGQQVQLWDCA